MYVGGSEFRSFRPIVIPAGQAMAQANIKPISRALIVKAVNKLVAAWNGNAMDAVLGNDFYDKFRLADAMNSKVPRDARLEVLSIQATQTLSQKTADSPSGELLLSIVSATVRTQLTFNDPVNGYQRREGTNEYIMRIKQYGTSSLISDSITTEPLALVFTDPFLPIQINTPLLTLTGTGVAEATYRFTPVNLETAALKLTGTGVSELGFSFAPITVRTRLLTITGTGEQRSGSEYPHSEGFASIKSPIAKGTISGGFAPRQPAKSSATVHTIPFPPIQIDTPLLTLTGTGVAEATYRFIPVNLETPALKLTGIGVSELGFSFAPITVRTRLLTITGTGNSQ